MRRDFLIARLARKQPSALLVDTRQNMRDMPFGAHRAQQGIGRIVSREFLERAHRRKTHFETALSVAVERITGAYPGVGDGFLIVVKRLLCRWRCGHKK